MMDERNPYSPSTASLSRETGISDADVTGGGVWRDGDVLVVSTHAELPHRCVKCNEQAREPMKSRNVYWHHPAVYALILVNIIVYAIVGAIVRRKISLAAGLCAAHTSRRQLAIAVGWGGAASGFAMVFAAMKLSDSAGVLLEGLGMLVVLGSIIAGVFPARIVYAKKIDKSFARLKGCGAPFLDTLPPFPG